MWKEPSYPAVPNVWEIWIKFLCPHKAGATESETKKGIWALTAPGRHCHEKGLDFANRIFYGWSWTPAFRSKALLWWAVCTYIHTPRVKIFWFGFSFHIEGTSNIGALNVQFSKQLSIASASAPVTPHYFHSFPAVPAVRLHQLSIVMSCLVIINRKIGDTAAENNPESRYHYYILASFYLNFQNKQTAINLVLCTEYKPVIRSTETI